MAQMFKVTDRFLIISDILLSYLTFPQNSYTEVLKAHTVKSKSKTQQKKIKRLTEWLTFKQ